ncbi:MAG: class I SAM-dependent methyltransferase [Rhodothermales bacterium]
MKEKFRVQSDQYSFPYHYLVDLHSKEFVRNLDWGLDYLTYMGKTIELARRYVRQDLLDVGCGDGYLLYNLGQDPGFPDSARALGIDVDERAIMFARAFSHGVPGVEFKVQDISTFDETFGLISTVETLEHIPDEEIGPFTGHINRLLKPGGVLLVSVPSTVRPVLAKHYRHYDVATLQGHFPGYAILEVHFMTARRNVLYQVVSRLLSARHLNLNFRPVKNVLFALHDRFTGSVSVERGAHIVAALRKP